MREYWNKVVVVVVELAPTPHTHTHTFIQIDSKYSVISVGSKPIATKLPRRSQYHTLESLNGS